MHQYLLSGSDIEIKMNSKAPQENKIQFDFDSIYNLYKKEFVFYCENILLKSRTDLLETFFSKMKYIINYNYKYENKENLENLEKIIKKCENDFITNEYIPMYNALSLTYSIISANLNSKNKIKYSVLNQNLNYINNFIPHCLYHKPNYGHAVHSCGEKFIQINKNIIKSNLKKNNEDKNNNNNIKYVLCPKCKKSYKYNLILIYCNHCEKNYFSKINEEKYDNCLLYPVTWKKYHCTNYENSHDINNFKYEEQMPCIKCDNSKFWIKKNKLFCKKCKFEIEPINLVWTCYICNKEFRSNIKIYNNLNHKIIKHIIRDALIDIRIAKPADLPCDCLNKYKIENINFYHKKEGKCNGILYYNSFNQKDFIICSLCQYICYLNDFNWFCPFCLRYFISNKIKIYIKSNNNKNKSNIPNIYIRKNILENKPKPRRYFSPNHNYTSYTNTKNDNNDTDNIVRDQIYSDRNHLRYCVSQKFIGENYPLPKNIDIINKINENNTTYKVINHNNSKYFNSQISTLYTSYQKDIYNQSKKLNQKVKTCNNSLDNKQKNNFQLFQKNSDKKSKKSNIRIYISNKKIQSKLYNINNIDNKCINSITKFNLEQNNNNNKNFSIDNNLRNNDIKLAKSKINISTSLIFNQINNRYNKENINYLNNINDNSINNKLIYSKTKRNKFISLKKNKNNSHINITTYKFFNKKKNSYMKNKTVFNFTQKKINEDKSNLKNSKLNKIIPDCLFKDGIVSQRYKKTKRPNKEKSYEIY